MSNEGKRIVDLLLHYNHPISASIIATQLNISIRSVRKYVSQLNSEYSGCIQSTPKGYLLDKEITANFHDLFASELPQTSEERINYILKKIMDYKEDSMSLNIYDLAEELFVSYATVKRDLNQVRTICAKYHLKLNIVGDFFHVYGSEFNRRKLMSHLYYQEFIKSDLSLSAIQNVFCDYDIEWIKCVITKMCSKHRYYINGYSLINLILDIVISLDRIRHHYVQKPSEDKNNMNTKAHERILALDIAKEFEQKFDITYNEQELQMLTVLLMSSVLRVNYSQLSILEVEEIVGKECVEIVNEVLEKISDNYLLNTNDEDFRIRFTMHISNLLMRLKSHYVYKNPLVDTIRNSCPLLFDCAVSIANEIQRITEQKISEDEVAFITLHMGTLFDFNEKEEEKIKCVLILPQYYDFSKTFKKKLMNHYHHSLEIIDVFSHQDEIVSIKGIDFIISTIPLNLYHYPNAIVISSFLKDKDFEHIDNYMNHIQKKKKKEKLFEQLLSISDPALFYRNIHFQTKEEIIHYMMNDMILYGYADQNYEEGILEREQLSSTAFDLIAVPHSLRLNAYKTKMSVMIYDKPAQWGQNRIKIVLLFTIDKNNIQLFQSVFDNLIVLLMEKENFARVMQSRNYEEFLKNIMECAS